MKVSARRHASPSSPASHDITIFFVIQYNLETSETLYFEAGQGGPSKRWSVVLEKIAKETKTFEGVSGKWGDVSRKALKQAKALKEENLAAGEASFSYLKEVHL